MPTETFFRLPQQKRERLMRAVNAELARVPFSALSINRIIREADISRGSYYQYFRDRDDLYEYLLAGYRACMQQSAEQTLLNQRGDVFLTVLAGFDESVRFARVSDNITVMQHLFSFRQPPDFLKHQGASGAPYTLLIDNLPLIDRSKLNCESDEDLMHILEILLSQLALALTELFRSPQDAPAQRARLQRKLELLKRGLTRASTAAERNAAC